MRSKLAASRSPISNPSAPAATEPTGGSAGVSVVCESFRKRRRGIRQAVTLGLLVAASSLAAWGQATAGFGGISGTVRDASNAAVPGAKVVVSNPKMGLKRELTTTDAGIFAAPALTPADGYDVMITKEGFAPYEAKGVVVRVGEVTDLTVPMTVGAMAQAVEVVGATPAV